MAGFHFHFPNDTSLAALAHRTQGTYGGRFDDAAARLVQQSGFLAPTRALLVWHQAARWRLAESIGMLVEFSAQPPNGPRTRRLAGIVRWEPQIVECSPILFMGPTRWEGPLEARLVPAEYRRCPLPDSLLDRGISGLTPDGALPVLPLLPPDLLPSFLAANGNLLHCDRHGAWCLLPDLATLADRRTALTCLRAMAELSTRAPIPAMASAPLPIRV